MQSWAAALVITGQAAGVSAATFAAPTGTDVVGELRFVQSRHEDTLSDIARRHSVGFEAIKRANPAVDPWLPGQGTWVTVPAEYVLPDAPRTGLVLNLPEMRLYYYPPPRPGGEAHVVSYPASIGRLDWSTPLGVTRVAAKVRNPTWYPPASIRKEHAAEGDELPPSVPPGEGNPLGEYALRLARPGYLIHGTNRPYGIGMRVTHGCVRLYPENIAGLFRDVPVGTPVRIVNQPYKAGWRGDALYLEVHPLLDDGPVANLTPLVRALINATRERRANIDWVAVERAAQQARGTPVRVSR